MVNYAEALSRLEQLTRDSQAWKGSVPFKILDINGLVVEVDLMRLTIANSEDEKLKMQYHQYSKHSRAKFPTGPTGYHGVGDREHLVSDIIASGTRVDGQSLFCEHSHKPGNKKASKSREASACIVCNRHNLAQSRTSRDFKDGNYGAKLVDRYDYSEYYDAEV